MIVKPNDSKFKAQFDVVSAFVRFGGTYLFLQHLDSNVEGGKWDTPRGRVKSGETTETATLRVLKEVTGFEVDEKTLKSLGEIHLIQDDVHFNCHSFVIDIVELQMLVLCRDTYQDYGWYKKDELSNMLLVTDMQECVGRYI